MKFTEKFDKYACVNDSIEIEENGVKARAVIHLDECYRIDDDDCHSTDQSLLGCDDETFERIQENRKAWFNNEWFYCGIVVTVFKNGIELEEKSLWGIDCNYPNSDNSYLSEVANELLSEIDIEEAVESLVEKLTA